jgi:hypothetical protein
VQRLDEVSDTWIIKRPSNDATSSFSSDNDNNNNIIANDKNALTNNPYNGESV